MKTISKTSQFEGKQRYPGTDPANEPLHKFIVRFRDFDPSWLETAPEHIQHQILRSFAFHQGEPSDLSKRISLALKRDTEAVVAAFVCSLLNDWLRKSPDNYARRSHSGTGVFSEIQFAKSLMADDAFEKAAGVDFQFGDAIHAKYVRVSA